MEINQIGIEIDSNLNNIRESKLKSDIELLNSMGFDRAMINKVYILLNPENIERAIDYMTEINGVYQHDFIPNNNINQINNCFICNHPKQNHLNYSPENSFSIFWKENIINSSSIINNISRNKSQVEEDNNNINNNDISSDEYECEVCYENINKDEKELNEIKCGHLFCSNCWLNYLKTLITEAKVENIKCMEHECKEIISEEFILKYIREDPDLVEKYKRFKQRAEILKDEKKKYVHIQIVTVSFKNQILLNMSNVKMVIYIVLNV